MAEGVYPNGLPYPSPETRIKIAIELGIIAVCTGLFLLIVPTDWRTNWTNLGLALGFTVYIAATARETREYIWGPPDSPAFDRVRRCFVNMTLLTVPPMIIFFGFGLIFGGVERVFKLNYLLALALYLPWALLQQTLFQFYLLGRLRALLPWATPWMLSTVNGLAYGLVHWPSMEIVAVTIIGGILWSYSYHRDRYVLPIAISHSLLGASFYFWVLDRDLIQELINNK